MKKLKTLGILLLFCGALTAQSKYKVPNDLNAQNFPGHAEITWKNHQGFTYEVYRMAGNTKAFVKQGETTKGYFLDFYGKNISQNARIRYRIIPKGDRKSVV